MGGRVGATVTMYLVDVSSGERPIGINVCVVKGWRSRMLMRNVGALAEGSRTRGKQLNMLIVGVPGVSVEAFS